MCAGVGSQRWAFFCLSFGQAQFGANAVLQGALEIDLLLGVICIGRVEGGGGLKMGFIGSAGKLNRFEEFVAALVRQRLVDGRQGHQAHGAPVDQSFCQGVGKLVDDADQAR